MSAAAMKAASPAPPEQQRKAARTTCSRQVPPDMTKEILQHLPIKSLIRFSVVSELWNSLIFDPSFIQQQKSRAAREMLVTIPSSTGYLAGASVCRISLASSDRPIAVEGSADLICPVEGNPYLHAFCDGLWIVQVEKSIYLWNPPMRICRKLPDPPLPRPFRGSDYELVGAVYGLAFDSAGDDFKVLKLMRDGFPSRDTELYSVKSNSWKRIPPTSEYSWIKQKKLEFVNGAFHWFCIFKTAIVSFNPSSEEYGEIRVPKSFPTKTKTNNSGRPVAEVVVLRGMLCVTLACKSRSDDPTDGGKRFVLWAMQEYGVDESWSKLIDIDIKNMKSFRPLFLYDNGDVLLKLSNDRKDRNESGVYIYRDNGLGLEEGERIVGRDGSEVQDGFIYVESLAKVPLQ